MVRYLARRVATGVGLLLLGLTLIFFVIRTVPGDPAALLASGGGSGDASPEAIAQIREQLGLDQPLWAQYFGYLAGVVRGDFGTSFQFGTDVTPIILERLPKTLELVLGATLIGVTVGIILGVIAARRGGVVSTIITAMGSFAISIPVYVLGTVLVFAIALQLRWLPAGGYVGWEDPADHLRILILPCITLAVPFAAIVATITRSGLVETAQQDWVRTARSWGMSPNSVYGRHVLRNSLTAVLTIVGLEIGLMFGSTILVEQVYSYPGLSQLMIRSVEQRDYPIVQGVAIMAAAFFILVNILVDVLYGVLDPRARRR
ncbi:ABC transporter permease [Microbacterium jejuense]|uniref:ABC transporter permease n=1 Tax=Microbacterium jejuense TaxID=1263637 RepID=UPI001CB7E72D|nr:ABC transporter permease [Microbacterium jejuense]